MPLPWMDISVLPSDKILTPVIVPLGSPTNLPRMLFTSKRTLERLSCIWHVWHYLLCNIPILNNFVSGEAEQVHLSQPAFSRLCWRSHELSIGSHEITIRQHLLQCELCLWVFRSVIFV